MAVSLRKKHRRDLVPRAVKQVEDGIANRRAFVTRRRVHDDVASRAESLRLVGMRFNLAVWYRRSLADGGTCPCAAAVEQKVMNTAIEANRRV